MSTSTDPTVRFWVPGRAAPQGSKRHVGRGILVESSKALKPWRTDIARVAAEAWPGDPTAGPVDVRLWFVFPRPAGHFGTGKNAGTVKASADPLPSKKSVPDLDKLVRAVLDALTGVVIRDDSQVCRIETAKTWGPRPGVEVEVLELVS